MRKGSYCGNSEQFRRHRFRRRVHWWNHSRWPVRPHSLLLRVDTDRARRCSEYRGATVAPSTLLNLTQQQFIVETNMSAPDASPAARRGPTNAKFTRGPLGGPAILPAAGLPAGGFHPSTNGSPRRGGQQCVAYCRAMRKETDSIEQEWSASFTESRSTIRR